MKALVRERASNVYIRMVMTRKQEKERRGALTTAHNDYSKGLNSYATFKVSNKALGEDLVQDTFIRTWNYLLKKGEIGGMKGFLYHVLNNLIVDEYRKRKHEPISLDVLMDGGYNISSDDSANLFNFLDGKRAISLISFLPKMYREAIEMRYTQDLTIKEICSLTNESENTISVRLHRGIKKLRVLYDLKPNSPKKGKIKSARLKDKKV